jgi:DHA1 family bicyclomycin/chloramphenicol resistance-like MFS transporter
MPKLNFLSVLILMVIFSPLAIDIFLPALPIMAKEFSVSMVQIQWSISVFLLSMGIGQLISGPLADRFGRRPIAIGGIVIYGLSSILSANSTTIEMFLIFRGVQGFGACAIVVAAFASVRDRYNPIQSGVIYSYLSSAICCIPALAPLLGNVLTVQFGWRSNFSVMALFAIIAGVIIVFSLPETRPKRTVKSNKLFTINHFNPIILHPVFLFNAMVVMISMAVIIAYVSSSPAWIMVNLGQSQQTFVFWFSLNAVINIIGYFLAPKVLIKLGISRTIELGLITLLVAGLLMLTLREWSNALGFMLPIMISSVAFSLLMGVCSGQALSPFGEKAGAASALLGFFQMSGSAILVSLLQRLPINVPEQLALAMLFILPVYLLWKIPKVKSLCT